ncbi:MAG: cytochrome c oxidase subunit 3 family protein [Pyrinomonadaceae bacterium]
MAAHVDDHGGHGAHSALQHHFENMEQQREAGTLGMWIFLVTEIMFFGGLFLAYTLYRAKYPGAFAAASNHLDLTLGAVNTVVLIFSSLTMALAVYSAQTGSRRGQIIFLIVTMILGATFLGIKAVEYHQKYVDHLIPGTLIPGHPFSPNIEELHMAADVSVRNVEMFYWIYFAMTGLHALHMIIGLGIMCFILFFAWRGRYSPEYHAPVEISGLYWHFVDIIWIFLFPLLYLLGRHLEHH